VIYGTALPFFGDVLLGSPETRLGATIFTAALADCGLVKKAMVCRGVKRRKKGAGCPMEGRGKQTPTAQSLTQEHHVVSCQGCRSIKNYTPKCKHHPLAL